MDPKALEVQLYSFFNLGARCGKVVNAKPRHPLYKRLGGPQGRVRKNLAPTGIRSPDRPACSQSLYPLSYPGPRAMPDSPRNLAVASHYNGCKQRLVFPSTTLCVQAHAF